MTKSRRETDNARDTQYSIGHVPKRILVRATVANQLLRANQYDLSIEVDRRIRNAWCSFRKYSLELYDRPSPPLELKIRMLKAEVLETMLYGCVTWGPRACHYDALRRAHHSFLTRCIGW